MADRPASRIRGTRRHERSRVGRLLVMRDNPKGTWSERWVHAAGCRRWFVVAAQHADERDPADLPMPVPTLSRRRPDRPRAAAAFAFEGAVYSAYKGDTLASALLANGIDCVSVSPVRGRAGIMTAGVEEPNALVEFERGGGSRWSGRPWWRSKDVEAWSVTGKGRLVAEPIRARYDKRYAHCDVLVIGGGASGLAARRTPFAGPGCRRVRA